MAKVSSKIAINILVIFAFAYVAYTSVGFDDEFHNIFAFYEAQSGLGWRDFIKYAAMDSVHPAGSYLISFLLREALPDWNSVRLVKTLAILAILYFSIKSLLPNLAQSEKVDWTMVAICSPSLLLWGTGLRWFGEFTAILALSLSVGTMLSYRNRSFIPILSIVCAILLQLNYLAIIFVPMVIILHIYRSKETFINLSIVDILCLILLAFLLAYTGYSVALADGSSQKGSLISSIVGAIQGITVNHGIFPLSSWGFFALISSCLVFGAAIHRQRMHILKNDLFWFVVVGTILISASGTGIKFRNITPLIPLIYALSISFIIESDRLDRRIYKFRYLIITPFIITSLVGYWNIIAREDTAKGSWNIPVAAAVSWLDNSSRSCSRMAIATWDPVITYHLWASGKHVYGFRKPDLAGPRHHDWTSKYDCLFLIRTSAGSFSNTPYFIDKPRMTGKEEIRLGYDRYHQTKSRLGAPTPEYYVSIFRVDRESAGSLNRYFEPAAFSQLRIPPTERD